jgi:hypothetical protein
VRAAPPPREAGESAAAEAGNAPPAAPRPQRGKIAPAEIGGPKGPEPTRYGDWERNGRCSDF